ncbi:hypothetical protein QBC45DRAFT_471601 [Copromyces sp. CBS 386.78]|nr:hypothetical protein QBC45DRAFT_471601 [Copromyces sp. CBS 386.78]
MERLKTSSQRSTAQPQQSQPASSTQYSIPSTAEQSRPLSDLEIAPRYIDIDIMIRELTSNYTAYPTDDPMRDKAHTTIERALMLHHACPDGRDGIMKAILVLHGHYHFMWTVSEWKGRNLELRVRLLSGMAKMLHRESRAILDLCGLLVTDLKGWGKEDLVDHESPSVES